ncbi:MAG: hypothetical protein UU93_C0004G0001 [Candidatus Amesbacteria bacterium GW2011_GWA2_42_12]|uniref:Uncharacterized protein n=1 Tax=Candidatus Amesbacteria bacterium GW2011_GWA2_42_12 TaxID=1618356 RepID=A0A0G0Y8B7_9BACT|nr:MAG: hypothetical protein UU93_C0004G0001 [Candidatus Amesbacteria bacterium GW2011_GWA2_42_12]
MAGAESGQVTDKDVIGRQTAIQFFRAQAVELGEQIMAIEGRIGVPGGMVSVVDKRGVSSGKYKKQRDLFNDWAVGIKENDGKRIQEAKAYLEKEVRKIEVQSRKLRSKLTGQLPDDEKFDEREGKVADLTKVAYLATDDRKYGINVSLKIAKEELLLTKRFKLQKRLDGLASKANEYGEVLQEL